MAGSSNSDNFQHQRRDDEDVGFIGHFALPEPQKFPLYFILILNENNNP